MSKATSSVWFVHVLLKQLLGKFLQIRNLRNCADSETSEVWVDYERLCVSVADYANARCATFEPVECRFELSPEIRTLQIVDRACETLLFTVHGETATASSEVWVVIGSVENICNAAFLGDGAKYASHKNVVFWKFVVQSYVYFLNKRRFNFEKTCSAVLFLDIIMVQHVAESAFLEFLIWLINIKLLLLHII